MMQKNKLFITGASGYIASSLLEVLANRPDFEITAVVRSSKSIPEEIASKINLIQGNVYDIDFIRTIVKGHNFIIHNTIDKTNYEGDINLVKVLGEEGRFATRDRPGLFLYTSGFYTAGSGIECEKEEIHEDTIAPSESPWNRKVFENLAFSYTTLNLSVAVIRPSWVFGGKLNEKSHYQEYIRYCKANSAICYRGDPSTLISFIHVDDLVQLYLKVIDNKYKGIFHGAEKAMTMQKHFDLLAAESKLPLKLCESPDFNKVLFYHAMDRKMSCNPGTLYASKTGWKVTKTFESSVHELFK